MGVRKNFYQLRNYSKWKSIRFFFLVRRILNLMRRLQFKTVQNVKEEQIKIGYHRYKRQCKRKSITIYHLIYF